MGKQVIASCDHLYILKKELEVVHPEYSIFEHDINRETDLGIGTYNGQLVKEKILTDGKISLQRRNSYSPSIIFQNVLVTLQNGLSICIEITDATFMVDIIKFGNKKEIGIHLVQEDKESINRVIAFLNKMAPQIDCSSISFKSPSILVLESNIDGKFKHEELDFQTGKNYSKKKNNQGHKRRKY